MQVFLDNCWIFDHIYIYIYQHINQYSPIYFTQIELATGYCIFVICIYYVLVF